MTQIINKNNIPQHVAIIMDGNGRWAKERALPRSLGHREGTKRVKEIVKAASELGVKVITFFAFSTENWSRPRKEIDTLMRYLDSFLEKEIEELDKNNIRFRVIGRDDPLPKYLQAKIKAAQRQTADNTGLVVVLALNYGGRQEIVDAVKKFTACLKKDEVSLEGLEIEEFNKYLYAPDLPQLDLLIRTSGEMRISNFLLWQLSYAELYFPKKYWPDFKRQDLVEAIEEYQRRQRRFGGLDAE